MAHKGVQSGNLRARCSFYQVSLINSCLTITHDTLSNSGGTNKQALPFVSHQFVRSKLAIAVRTSIELVFPAIQSLVLLFLLLPLPPPLFQLLSPPRSSIQSLLPALRFLITHKRANQTIVVPFALPFSFAMLVQVEDR